MFICILSPVYFSVYLFVYLSTSLFRRAVFVAAIPTRDMSQRLLSRVVFYLGIEKTDKSYLLTNEQCLVK